MESQFTGDRRKNRDRRRATRTAVSAAMEISFDTPVPTAISASLIETSSTGFRASHDSKAIEPGLNVSYKRDGVSGQARVIWTHILEGRRVSGFLVTGRADDGLPPPLQR
jgi:hypothetical protein